MGSSVPAQSDSGGGVVSVGAIDAVDVGTTDDIEAFSSRGPANNGVIKPDVAAVDGVSVTGAGMFPNTFFGTSAAAPHVAGLAALLLEVAPGLLSGEPGDDPDLDRAALRAAIVDNAVDLGVSGDDNTFGSGRVDGAFFTAQPLVPDPPTTVVAVAGDSQATVSWSAPASDGGFPITRYTVTSTPGGLSATADGSVSSATVTGLIDGTLPYTFTVTAANAVGTSTASAASSVVIPINELPVVQVGQDITANEGEVLSLQLATFTDAGISDTHTASVDWGDGSGPEAGVLDQGAGTVSGSHVYADDGAFAVTVTVTDSDGGFGSSGLTVNASNVAPVVNAGQDKEVRAGSSLDIGATFTDAGSGDTHASTIQWGDGSGSEVGVLDQGAGTVSGSHVYATQGAYELTVTVTDDDGGSGSDSVTVIAIPGLTEWGLIVLGSVFGLLVLLQTQRRRPNRRSGSPTL